MSKEEKTYGELLEEGLAEAVEIKEGRAEPARRVRHQVGGHGRG